MTFDIADVASKSWRNTAWVGIVADYSAARDAAAVVDGEDGKVESPRWQNTGANMRVDKDQPCLRHRTRVGSRAVLCHCVVSRVRGRLQDS